MSSNPNRRHSVKWTDDERTPYSPRWQAPNVPPEPITMDTMRAVYTVIADRPSTALWVAAVSGIEYADAFAALEMLSTLGKVEPMTNGRYQVRVTASGHTVGAMTDTAP